VVGGNSTISNGQLKPVIENFATLNAEIEEMNKNLTLLNDLSDIKGKISALEARVSTNDITSTQRLDDLSKKFIEFDRTIDQKFNAQIDINKSHIAKELNEYTANQDVKLKQTTTALQTEADKKISAVKTEIELKMINLKTSLTADFEIKLNNIEQQLREKIKNRVQDLNDNII